jgi:hypothetical protein
MSTLTIWIVVPITVAAMAGGLLFGYLRFLTISHRHGAW